MRLKKSKKNYFAYYNLEKAHYCVSLSFSITNRITKAIQLNQKSLLYMQNQIKEEASGEEIVTPRTVTLND